MYILGKGHTRKVDLMKLLTEDGNVIISFLAFTWAIIADIDLESETIRFCGGNRFIFWAIWRVLWMRRYHAKIQYCLMDSDEWITSDGI